MTTYGHTESREGTELCVYSDYSFLVGFSVRTKLQHDVAFLTVDEVESLVGQLLVWLDAQPRAASTDN